MASLHFRTVMKWAARGTACKPHSLINARQKLVVTRQTNVVPFLEPVAVSAAAQFISRHLPRAPFFPPGPPKKGVYSLTGNASFPFHAEPAQNAASII